MLFILYNVHLYYFLLRCICFFWSWRQIPYFYLLEWIKIVLIRGYDIDMECVCFFLQNIVKNKILCGFWWNGGICLWIKVVFILAILGFYRTLELLKIFGGKSRSFLSLADVSSVSHLAKPNNPYAKRKNLGLNSPFVHHKSYPLCELCKYHYSNRWII
jgi:hypothetical protein